MDDWRFNEDLIGYPLQLLWFEGKPIVIARPQNQFAGHLRYSKDDPVFITTLLSDLDDKTRWDDLVTSAGQKLKCTVVRRVNKDENTEPGETRRWVSGRLGAGTSVRHVAVSLCAPDAGGAKRDVVKLPEGDASKAKQATICVKVV